MSRIENAEWMPWHDAKITLPDTDRTVLCWGVEGFFCGYRDQQTNGWIACESGGSVSTVSHWSEPQGPQGNDSLSGPNAARREGRDGGESCGGPAQKRGDLCKS